MLIIGISGTVVVSKVLGQTSTQEIYACVQNKTGILRIVIQGTTCRANETSLSWNIQGPPGPSGNSGLPFFCQNCYLTPFADKFAGKDFSKAQINHASFNGADLTSVIFKGGWFSTVEFNDTNLSDSNFSYIRSNPYFGYSFNTLFHNANLTNADFSNGDYDFDFRGANLQNTNFSNTTFQYCNFSGARNMSTATVTGVTWISDTCPDGTDSDNDGHTCVGHF